MAVSAIRVKEGVELPEFELPDDRVLAIAAEAVADEDEFASDVAMMWRELSADGESEERFRARLRAFGAWANRPLPDYQPRTTVSDFEASELLAAGLAVVVR